MKAHFLASSLIDSPLDGDGDGGVAGREEAHLREGDGVGDEVDEDVVAVRGDQRGQREAEERVRFKLFKPIWSKFKCGPT